MLRSVKLFGTPCVSKYIIQKALQFSAWKTLILYHMKIERMLLSLLQYESIFSRGLSKIPNQMDFFPLDFDMVWKKQSSTLRHIHFRSLAPLFLSPCQCWSFFLIGNSNFFDLLSKTNFKGNVEWSYVVFLWKLPKNAFSASKAELLEPEFRDPKTLLKGTKIVTSTEPLME